MAEDARVARGPHDKHAVHARIVERLKGNAEEVTRMVAGLAEADLARRTVADKWSVKELLCHLDRIHEVFDDRVTAMLEQDNPKLPPYEPDGDAAFDERVKRSTADTLAAFLAASRASHRPARGAAPGGLAPARPAPGVRELRRALLRRVPRATTRPTTSIKCSNGGPRWE